MIPSDKRTAPTCNIFTRELLSRIGDKWSILIIAHLAEGPLRFNILRRTIGQVSQRVEKARSEYESQPEFSTD